MNIYRLFLSLFFTLGLLPSLAAQCKIADLINSNKASIEKPFKYDGFNYINFEFTQVNQSFSKEFVAFKNQDYILVFAGTQFEEQITVIISSAETKEKVAELTLGQGKSTQAFKPLKTGSYLLTYSIPPSDTEFNHQECVAMLIGFSEQ